MKRLDIALAGNPNAGKTTMFNALTGGRQRVGNYPGVTVTKREGHLSQDGVDINVVDLPGTYSLTAFTQEEVVARTYLIDSRPSCVVNVVDATNLERNLYLTVQLLELGVPVVVALNMMDEMRNQGRHIDTEKLSKHLGVPVVETVARTGDGVSQMVAAAVKVAEERQGAFSPIQISYGPDLDPVLDDLREHIKTVNLMADRFPNRWLGLKFLENDPQVLSMRSNLLEEVADKVSSSAAKITRHCQATLGVSPESVIADYRYGFIASIVKDGVMTDTSPLDRLILSDNIDRVVTHRFFGPLMMLGVLYGMFHITFTIGDIPMGWLGMFFDWLGGCVTDLLPAGHLQSLIVSGIIDGVGGVLGFVPLIFIMFMMITFLEDSGYMARMAYMMDRVLRMFGLHGASVMPFIVSGGIPGGCAVPGVMATRVLRSPKEKLATLLVVPFMNCGAKVPVFLLLSAAFFKRDAAVVMFIITLGSWAAALIVARILRWTIIRGAATPFLMELPPYRLPTMKGLFIHTWERAWEYIKKAGTVILAISILIWAAMTYPGLPEPVMEAYKAESSALIAAGDNEGASALHDQMASTRLKHSVAGRLGVALEPVSGLAGFDWRSNIALIGGVAAKEVIVSALGTAYSLGNIDSEASEGLSQRLAGDPFWNKSRAMAFIVFVMLYAPCFVTVVTMAREASWKWAGFSIVFNTTLAFLVSVVVFQLSSFFS